MRSGTSKGPYIDMRDLPTATDQRDKVLLKILGSPQKSQIDGIGGGTFVTSKVVLVKPSERENVDVDYLFAQVIVGKPIVDTSPTCGNMMAGVGPYAIENGWVKAGEKETTVKIYSINTASYIDILVQTPGGKVVYDEGDFAIDGVDGTASPILITMYNFEGGMTGKLFPSGNKKDVIDSIEVSIVDGGNLMLLIKAEDLGMTGLENQAFFDSNVALKNKIEAMRIEAGLLCGLGNVSDKVLPKVGILSKAIANGNIKSQYLTPHSLHSTHAVTGAVCIATASKAKGTIAAELAIVNSTNKEEFIIEHPSGKIPVLIEVSLENNNFKPISAGTYRTVRKLMEGYAFY